MSVFLIIYGLVVLALLAAELREDRRAQALFKPLAALGFILIAVKVGALDSLYGQIILAGLVACALGDILLLSRNSQKLFIAGMAAFALGHIAYSIGFLHLGVDPVSQNRLFGFNPRIGIMYPLLIAMFATFIIKGKSKSDRIAIIIYTSIISLMVMLAWWTQNPYAALGAILFAISDFFVGMDRFQDRKKWYPLAITPLYFGAQLLFALSTQV